MKILHYSLGFPPYRTGGLTKFCMDLMKVQVKEGHEIALLWPGEIKLISHKTSIKKRANVYEISSFEVINPLPVSFDEGVKDFDAYLNDGDKSVYEGFLSEYKPDVIHIHTLMGLHKSFLVVAKEKGIRLVFTTHDFYPICPKVTMFRHGKICESIDSCEECGVCNNTALSLKKIQILQSPVYRSLKDSKIVKILRKRHRDEYLSENTEQENVIVGASDDYKRLRNYYYSMLQLMDIIHYNSSVAKAAYERVFYLPKNLVINISHSDIVDHRKEKIFNQDILRIRYLGPQSGAKGYFLLKDALDELWKIRQDFCLDIHFDPLEKSPYMRIHGRYNYSELEHIFDETDILVAPSIWYETFGFTVLEALSYGVPVIVSDHVGSKDIIADGAGIVVCDLDLSKLITSINSATKENLWKMNYSIRNNQIIMDMNDISKMIEEAYI